MKVTLTGRLVSNIFKARTQEQTGKDKYWVQLIVDDNQITKLKSAKQDALKEIFGEKIPQGSGLIDHFERIGDDPEFSLTFEKHFVRASSMKPIKCFLKTSGNLQNLDQTEASMYMYPGAYVAVSLDIYGKTKAEATNFGGKAFISSGVRGIMFLRHGEPLGDGMVDESEFSDYDSDLDENDFSA